LLKDCTLATVQKILGLDRSPTSAIDLNFTDAPFQGDLKRKWRGRG
jgi:hypothetical protein